MRRARLLRGEGGDQGMPGRLALDSGESWPSLELPWRGNVRQKSCIPAGVYVCLWGYSRKFGWRWEVTGVPGRSAVLIHAANRAGDTEKGWKSDLLGCIALGKVWGRLGGQLALFQSRIAIAEFHKALAGERQFLLEVCDVDRNS